MSNEELVRRWKQPRARRDEAVDHPSGQIVLRSGGGLARRAGLLAERVSSFDTISPWTTLSAPVAPELG
jgi:hypothetical protein